MAELTREEIIVKLSKMAGVTEEEVKEYITKGDRYIDSLPEDIQSIDGDEQIEYIYENSNLDPSVIDRISEAEIELLYSDEEE